MGALQILVEAVPLGNKLLLPLSESLFLDLDLLGKSLPESLFLFLELGVVELSWSRLSELPCLHLLRTVDLVVLLLGGVDKIQHVCPDKDRSDLFEVAVFLVLDFRNTPSVLTALHDVSIVGLDVFLGTNNGEWHGGHEAAGVGCGLLVILLDGWLVDLDSLSFDNGLDLLNVNMYFHAMQ